MSVTNASFSAGNCNGSNSSVFSRRTQVFLEIADSIGGLPPKSERTILKNAEDIEGKEKHVLNHCDARQKHGDHLRDDLTLYENLKTLEEADAKEELFKAARGWFRRFDANFWFENVPTRYRL
jgi:hypothetical protein